MLVDLVDFQTRRGPGLGRRDRHVGHPPADAVEIVERSLATVLATYDCAIELDEGLAIVLVGLRGQLRS